MSRTQWVPLVRAVLIALHVFAITVVALPSAGAGLNRKQWSNPTVQEEFQAWSARLASVGVSRSSEQLQDDGYAIAKGWHGVQVALARPFATYYEFAGTHQSWRMFIAPHRYPGRLHIDVRIGGAWRPIYQARSENFRWEAEMLDQDRFRSLIFRYNWDNYQPNYSRFATWISKRAFADFPDADQVRTRFYVYKTASPEQVLTDTAPKGEFKRELLRRRK